MLYSDAHLHTNPVKGLGAEKVAKKFKKEGGWFIALVALPPYHYDYMESDVRAYRKVVELLWKESLKARENGLKVASFIGFHPAEVDYHYKRGLRGEEIFKLAEEVLRVIENAIKEGLVNGIGEVGRPHYSTSPERAILSEAIMMRTLLIAKDHNVPVQLHLEQGGFATAYTVRFLVERIGLKPEKVLLHHANIDTAVWGERFGFYSTVPVKNFSEKIISQKLIRYMIESDFLDDPQRPGVSAYPWDIPSVVKINLSKGLITEEDVYKVMVDNVSKFFGVEPP